MSLGDVYYAYATNARHVNIQVIRSTGLINWERVGYENIEVTRLSSDGGDE